MRKLAGLLFIILVCSSCGTTEERLSSKAVRIHRKILSIDTHCDTPMEMMRTGYDLGLRNEKGCVDFPRMREGSLDGEFFAVFIPQGHRNDSMSNVVHLNALEIFKRIHENVEKNSDMAGLAVTADDAFRLKKKGRLSAFIGLENGYPIGNDISRISQYYDLGA
ncbi:MAG TPA: membrane dipeptidase, partial [Bacteroidales bacterium]|nr:membrane dipeptidase [Bacteroidales bacterium]